MPTRPTRTAIVVAGTAATLTATALAGLSAAAASDDRGDHGPGHRGGEEAQVEILAPRHGDVAGIGGAGWVVDLAVDVPGGLRAAGFTAPQLTGPLGHAGIGPFPGTFSPGQDDRLPGLVALLSTTTAERPGFSGPGTNLANLFNLTGVTDRSRHGVQIWDTWLVGAPIAGQDVVTTLTVAVVADLDGNGVFDDAPDVVPDVDGNGVVDRRDLRALGVASDVETVTFTIAGAGV